MWELHHIEDWAPKNWCFWTVVLEKTLESPLDCKEIKPVIRKGNQPWLFIEKTDAEAPILWPPDSKSQLTGKDPDVGKGWEQEEKQVTEYEMVGWHHRLNRHESEQTSGDSEGQKPGMLQLMGSQRVRHNWATEQYTVPYIQAIKMLQHSFNFCWETCVQILNLLLNIYHWWQIEPQVAETQGINSLNKYLLSIPEIKPK